MAGIFINYRRDDAPGVAGRLEDRLVREFSQAEIFMDVDAMKPGLDFVEQLDEQVSKCDVLLAVIGPGWISATDDKGRRRLNQPDDYVRLELASALKRRIPVIPLLVHGATMPAESELPDDLKSLRRRHAMEIRHTRFAADCEALVRVLHGILPQKGTLAGKLSLAIPIVLGIALAGVAAFWWRTNLDGKHNHDTPVVNPSGKQPDVETSVATPPAPTANSADDPSPRLPETPATRITSFDLRSPSGEQNDPGVRKWTRLTSGDWQQTYPHGSTQINYPIKRTNVHGCDGTIVVDPVTNENFQSFIPDKNCPNMVFFFRYLPSRDWRAYVPLENVK